ncbi:CHAT domain-containing protein [Streptomyces sp. NPDC006385]|uniref:CHAT domain-containing tetratricopeptide repeat protein n=1 Tax=Streptomyces sp. NPDC006385 TaxID=3156761 RepID=UPI0033A2C941
MRREHLDELLALLTEYEAGGDPESVTGFEALRVIFGALGRATGEYHLTGTFDPVALRATSRIFDHRIRAASTPAEAEQQRTLLRSVIKQFGSLPAPTTGGPALPTPEDDLEARHAKGVRLLDAARNERNQYASNGAVVVLREVVERIPDHDHAFRAFALSNLRQALMLRYGYGMGQAGDIDTALRHMRTAVSLSAGAPQPLTRALHAINHAEMARFAFNHTQNPAQLEEARAAYRSAYELHPEPDIRRELRKRAVVCASLLVRLNSAPDVLDDTVAFAVRTLPAETDKSYAQDVHAIAELYQRAYQQGGNASHLRQAQAYFEQGLGHAPPGHPARAEILEGLALNHRLAHERGNDPAHLEAAIAAGRDAVAASPGGYSDASLHLLGLQELSETLRGHYAHSITPESLVEAIEAARQAVAVAPPDPERARRSVVLCILSQLQFQRTEDPLDLHEAVEAGRAGLRGLAAEDPSHVLAACSLASALLLLNTPDALDEGVATLTDAARLLPPDHPYTQRCAVDLSGMLHERYRTAGRREDLDQAVEVGRAAVAVATDGPYGAEAAFRLGTALAAAHAADGRAGPAQQAIERFRDGAAITSAPPDDRLTCAVAWGSTAAASGAWVEATRGHTYAVGLRAEQSVRRLRRPDEKPVPTASGHGSLVQDAVAAAIRAGDPVQALRLAEQGRAMLLDQALDSRSDLTLLEQVAPDLVPRFRDLGAARDVLGAGTGPGNTARSAAAEREHRAALAREWDTLLAEIRDRGNGLEDFLRPPDEAQLRAVAEDGPVVVLNVSRYGADAVVLRADRVFSVPLPGLSLSDLTGPRGWVTRFVHAMRTFTGIPGEPAAREMRAVFAWLWEAVAEPVLSALGHNGTQPDVPSGPRLWWSPTGPLTLLPVHMAGRHDGSRDNVLDRVVSSYATTVRALRHARSRPARTSSSPLAGLVVSQPFTGRRFLREAEAEAWLLQRRFPNCEVLPDHMATRKGISRALLAAHWVHFACHASSDPTRPETAYLQAIDGRLTLTEICQLRLSNPEFAYLGACDTARGGEDLCEPLHLASAFQLAGYRHVVAAQWPLPDDIALAVAKAFYERFDPSRATSTGVDPALALHAALCQVRAEHPGCEEQWGAFVHFGA